MFNDQNASNGHTELEVGAIIELFRTTVLLIILDLFLPESVSSLWAYYTGIHNLCPCGFFWPSRHNFRDVELKFCIFP